MSKQIRVRDFTDQTVQSKKSITWEDDDRPICIAPIAIDPGDELSLIPSPPGYEAQYEVLEVYRCGRCIYSVLERGLK